MKRLLALALVAGCGQDAVPAGGDDVPIGEPVFYGEVQRIFNTNCVECHSEDPARLAPFSLVKYEDAVAAATDFPMAYDLMNRVMPPFYARQDGDCGSFPNAHWLSDEDLETLTTWINGNKLAGDPANTVAPPPAPGGLTRVDHTVDTGAPFTPDLAKTDDFQCFVVDAIGADTFVVGAHVKPGNLTVAHHVILFTLDQAAETEALQRQSDAGGAYQCDGGPTRTGNANFLVGWVPGTAAQMFPANTGIRIDGTRKMVVQMHYNTANSNGQPDHTTIDLVFASSVATPAQMIRISGDVDLAPHDTDAIAVGTQTIPNAVATARLWGFGVHMHQRGTGATMTVANDNDRCLMDLVNWSFHWQHFYWYEQPVQLGGGDQIRLTCHYDTTSDAARVGFCESTACEMCIEFGYVTQ